MSFRSYAVAGFLIGALATAASAEMPGTSRNADLEPGAKKFFAGVVAGNDMQASTTKDLAAAMQSADLAKIRQVPGVGRAAWHYVSGLDRDAIRFGFFDLTLPSKTLRLTYGVNSADLVTGFYVSEKVVSASTMASASAKNSLAQIAANGPEYDRKQVSVDGIAFDVKATESRAGSPYTTFSLCEAACMIVYLHGRSPVNPGDRLQVDGTYEQTVEAGEYVFHNEIVTSDQNIHLR